MAARRFLQRLEQFRFLRLQVFDDFPIFALDGLDVDLLDMDQAQQLANRLRHVAAAFVAGAATLGYADLGPELGLVHPQLAADLAYIEAIGVLHDRVLCRVVRRLLRLTLSVVGSYNLSCRVT
ncbi:hypothetical protein SDC9_180751 [bioreactor metagenome]|uniref:Uncharacterized protein n=1 Tax=bioreactor metagenome TaxID=1076179 RepID=A0A645H452_9ZZZZ